MSLFENSSPSTTRRGAFIERCREHFTTKVPHSHEVLTGEKMMISMYVRLSDILELGGTRYELKTELG
jgi:hypothetical protein